MLGSCKKFTENWLLKLKWQNDFWEKYTFKGLTSVSKPWADEALDQEKCDDIDNNNKRAFESLMPPSAKVKRLRTSENIENEENKESNEYENLADNNRGKSILLKRPLISYLEIAKMILAISKYEIKGLFFSDDKARI